MQATLGHPLRELTLAVGYPPCQAKVIFNNPPRFEGVYILLFSFFTLSNILHYVVSFTLLREVRKRFLGPRADRYTGSLYMLASVSALNNALIICSWPGKL